MTASSLSSTALVSSDLRECVEVDFLLLFRAQIWPDFQYSLGTFDVPHHRMRAYTPAIDPTNDAAPIDPDQICDRDPFTLIFVHCLKTF
ncbi:MULTISPECIES: hypothetical protein [Thalassobacter]|uniref:hypothetical protein n=1 Tax=Thalassobacter TaxID=266808 RepID=UPI0005707AFE|nr:MULTISPECIES: hypothetical protein [Thalassobacter]